MMGQTLSEPVTKKETAGYQNSSFQVASSSMQGWRVTMEDCHTVILSLPDDPNAAFFGVFDGHGGGKIAKYASEHLHKFILSQEKYKEGDIAEAMKRGFLDLDDGMSEDEDFKKEHCGTTAITVLIKDNKLYCANLGDSRAVASCDGKPKPLSKDHKPNNFEEHTRIRAAGGWVESDRVNGSLALSRAFGDFIFKRNPNKKPEEQIVTAYPDVTVHELTPDWEFIVLACDGIWDVMENREVVRYVEDKIERGWELEKICENLMMCCLGPDRQMAGLGCDNMTVVIVALLHGKSYSGLAYKFRQKRELEEQEEEALMYELEIQKYMEQADEGDTDDSNEEPPSGACPKPPDESNKEPPSDLCTKLSNDSNEQSPTEVHKVHTEPACEPDKEPPNL